MNSSRVFQIYLLGCLAQCLIGAHWFFSPYLLLCLLPGLLLALPVSRKISPILFTAFFSGLAVDFFTDGMLGLSSCALLPVALLRNPLYRLLGGEEIFTYKDASPLSHISPWGTLFANLVACLLFFCVYVWADGAGLRPFDFNAARVVVSSICSAALCTLLGRFIFVDKEQRWR